MRALLSAHKKVKIKLTSPENLHIVKNLKSSRSIFISVYNTRKTKPVRRAMKRNRLPGKWSQNNCGSRAENLWEKFDVPK